MGMATELTELEGRSVGFCGVDGDVFCIMTPDGERVAFEVLEDPADGYRSYLGEVKRVNPSEYTFFAEPIVTLTVGADSELDGTQLVDASGHVWLRFGTDNYDDYYPCFAFRYDPPRQGSPSESEASDG